MEKPLVTVIVPTKNSSKNLASCLHSIKSQSYENIELLVVDNHSDDNTKIIASDYASDVFDVGPERSAQVNFGASQAKGQFIFRVDSDFVLDPEVIAQCVDASSKGYDAVIVHNSPDRTVSWIAKLRKFEVDMYKYDLTHSAARFIKKKVFDLIGGYNEDLIAGEDYDLQNRLNRHGFDTGFIEAEAIHLGEPEKLLPHLKQLFRYGKDFSKYRSCNKIESGEQLRFFRRVYFQNWKNFIENPVTGLGFILYHIMKFLSGGLGYVYGKIENILRYLIAFF